MVHDFDGDLRHLFLFGLFDDKLTDSSLFLFRQFHHHAISALTDRIHHLLYLKRFFAAVFFDDIYLITWFILFIIVGFHWISSQTAMLRSYPFRN